MAWWYILVALTGVLVAAGLGLYWLGRVLERREPYGSFIRLRTRQKLDFCKSLFLDRRVPWYIKLVPVLLVLYLANPIDLIPDFIPVLGYLDDVAVVVAGMVLVIWLTPRPVIESLLEQVSAGGEQKPVS
ncbi:MAG: DUF1232 domain-containing protein [Chloroflexi bacterium]|nr:DUF1232 domain-containing protein [Chloroflexota bacterium]